MAKETVLRFINALNEEDFTTVRSLLNDDFTFTGVLGTRNGADVYTEEIKQMKLKYDVKKAFEDENDVCLWYNILIGNQSVFSSGWYQLKNGKISSFKVLFDPRPLFEKAAGN
ncbi:nuclear transport factor 2 family protein [Chitinophaga sp. 212800010-3]|uniref:nuclear transport factor 2 family protein n=1 Tax=unclassified Chitinophaga TaxID=2619133 RepID=UPI002DE67DC1|nr:SnoaL-like domain-containing protein [Chitinophaga sp. 212800010-3]